MNWDKVQTGARDLGYLVFAMDQGQTPVLTQPGPWGSAFDGFCNGCATRWIALRYSDKDFGFNPKTLECKMPDWRATRDQNVYESAKGDFPDNLAPGFAKYGLTLNKGTVKRFKKVATGKMLLQAGVSKKGCYYVSLREADGGHAVAVQNLGNGKWRFFDANEGEFHAESDENFEKFMDWYLEATHYEDTYTNETRIVRVNAPPYVLSGFKSVIKELVKIVVG